MKQKQKDIYNRVVGAAKTLKNLGSEDAFRKELSKRADLSVAQCDRYYCVSLCIAEIQKIYMREDINLTLEVSNSIKACNKKEQEILARIIIKAFNEIKELKRPAQKRLVNLFKYEGLHTWEDIREGLNKEGFLDTNKRDNKKEKDVKKINIEQNTKELFKYIDKMTGEEFEEWCKSLLLANGYYNVSLTERSYDNGRDIEAENEYGTFCFQCKKKANGKVGIEPIQEVYSAKDYGHYNIAIVITNKEFTDNAKKLAEGLSVILWDRNKLFELYKNV